MFTSDETVQVYRDLADYHERQGLDQLRDRFLVLAAAAAQKAGQSDEAERLRQRLLKSNEYHLLRSFPSMAQAMSSPDVQNYVEDLRQEYPLRAAEDLLASVRGPVIPPSPSSMLSTPRRSTRALPPTAPVIDLDNPSEKLKVFSGQEDADVPILPAWNDPPPRKTSFPSARPSKLLSSAASARPATIPVKRLTVHEPPAELRRRTVVVAEEPEEIGGGRWVGLVLFVLVLAGALYLLGVTLVQPFMP
jgi:hypothetical protein